MAKGSVRAPRRARQGAATARVDRRTKSLLRRVAPGEVAVIAHEDLDRVAAEGLVAAGVSSVINASPSISGRYPNLGPIILIEAGIPLVDSVGPLLLRKVGEGDTVKLDGDRVFLNGTLVGVGIRQSRESVLAMMEAARDALADRLDGFARNTLDFMQQERDLLFGGMGLPRLDHDLARRHVLVVVRGYTYREDLTALRPYIREIRPVLVGVDGGADALMDAGYLPDLIIGDMDSVSDVALALARPGQRRATEVVVHAYADGRAPGAGRLEQLGIPFKIVKATGTSEDVAFLLAHEAGADLIVAVGTHGNLREFLDKGRAGMASTFLVRLRVGEILVDAKGVSRLYPGRIRARDTLLLVGGALVAIGIVIAASEPLRLVVRNFFEEIAFWIRGLL